MRSQARRFGHDELTLERREDIPSLVTVFADNCVRRMNRQVETVPAETMRALMEYDWPGNVRELENFIERAVILSPGSELRAPLEDLDWSKQITDGPTKDFTVVMYEAGPGLVFSLDEDTRSELSRHSLSRPSGRC